MRRPVAPDGRALQAAVRLARHRAVAVVAAVERRARRGRAPSEVLHQHQLGDGEAVVHFHQVDLAAGSVMPASL
jgi:hypothetical protein